MFDTILYKRKETTIYLRVPFVVTKGDLDSSSAIIRFQTPFIIKHVMNIGLDEEESSTMTVTGLEQFSTPEDPGAHIEHKDEFAIDAHKKLDQIVEDATFSAV